LKTERSSN